ncbi:MAG: hypothetical protein IK114_04405 [Fibrobacter sp.]|nr:hypothetical protein [Fibrobacter sp.]
MRFAFLILLACGIANAFFDTHIHNVDADVSGHITVDEESRSQKEAEELEEKIDYYIERFDTDKAWALSLIDIS